MKSSPVQLVYLVFDKVSVELDPKHAPQEPFGYTSAFSFDGVLLKTAVGFGEVESALSDEQVFEVSLELSVENKKQKDKKSQKFSPYLLELRGRAIVRLLRTATKLAPLEDLAAVNGAALIWGAMREQVAALTARMPAGQILLPTVHFHDLRSDVQKTDSQELPRAAAPALSRSESSSAE